MKEMSREEKIHAMERIFQKEYNHTRFMSRAVCEKILDTIEPPKIKEGMIGKFYSSWDSAMYGKLYEITNKNRYIARGGRGTTWDHFIPMTPDEIKKELEEIIK